MSSHPERLFKSKTSLWFWYGRKHFFLVVVSGGLPVLIQTIAVDGWTSAKAMFLATIGLTYLWFMPWGKTYCARWNRLAYREMPWLKVHVWGNVAGGLIFGVTFLFGNPALAVLLGLGILPAVYANSWGEVRAIDRLLPNLWTYH